MTVGQRIMQKRKELGLSQEALGEQLGVSRQAIYKWESDSSLPEIEKLVALSKIFSVTVGWLLGVEEENTGAAVLSDSGELTESQIKMVEEITSRYEASLPQPEKSKKSRRWIYAAAVTIILVMAVSLVRLNGRLKNLQSNYKVLQNSVSLMDHRVGDQISSITTQVEDVLNRVNSFTIEQGSKIESVDFEAGTITFSVYAVPKTFVEGMTAHFTAACDGQMEQAEGTLGKKQDFSGVITVPLTNEPVELSVTFISEGKQELQPISTYRELYDCSFPYFEVEAYPLFFDIREDVFAGGHRYHLSVNANPIRDGMPVSKVDPNDIRLGLFADGKLVRWMVPAEPDEDSKGGDALTFRNAENIRMDRSKIYVLAAVASDHFGREIVVPGLPISYSEQSEDWSFAKTDANGLISVPDKWEY